MSAILAPAAERRRRPRSAASSQALHFAVPGLHLCLPLECVTRVLPIMALQELPQAPPWVLGLLNLGGEILPVLDLALWLQRPAHAYDLDTPVLLCSDGRRSAGLLVQRVDGVGPLDDADRRGRPLAAGEQGSPFVCVFERGESLSFMLDIGALLQGAGPR
ncbi:chemotaxis protein CheW [Pelomonas sp. KK5]|uniref:chemotaxis protein CheW n=1 Tax=Pelomonas sp. KK5 TaxID=1855730 RepID=UPI00097C5171|nr:chemotaxis protein CheW [Pelomonas sp. KK5]